MDALLEVLVTGAAAVIEPVVIFVGQLLVEILIRVALIPVFCIVLTPVILIYACFGPGRYFAKVTSTYGDFVVGCLKYGVWL